MQYWDGDPAIEVAYGWLVIGSLCRQSTLQKREEPTMKKIDLDQVMPVLADVPDYQAFLAVDELKASTRELAAQHPDVVTVLPVGKSRQGDPIEALKIGDGPKTALLFAMPHPNEPIGSMTLEYLAGRLAEDSALRESLGYTWYLIKCIDPDGMRLNEGWFKGPFSLENYARDYYRPPMNQQVDWTFPVDYKTVRFDQPLPETQALMTLIEHTRPDFLYSLHNSGFGGAYFYISEEAKPLHEPFHALVKSQELPLHLGEPEIPIAKEHAKAIFELPSFSALYDFLEESGGDPANVITGGASSDDYARRLGDPFCLVCEMPYFYNSAIHDTSPADIVRRDAILQRIEQERRTIDLMRQQYEAIRDELTIPSPFCAPIVEIVETWEGYLDADENWAKTDPKTAAVATAAEKMDNLVISKFYNMLNLGMFMRLLSNQAAATGESLALTAARQAIQSAFDQTSRELDAELEYGVIPIQKLVRVQLGSALLAAGYAAERG